MTDTATARLWTVTVGSVPEVISTTLAADLLDIFPNNRDDALAKWGHSQLQGGQPHRTSTRRGPGVS